MGSGDPLFLEPFWVKHATSSAIVVAGWHRMSYTYNDNSFISKELEKLIRKVHAHVGNAITENRYIVFGAGSTQLLAAAVHALSPTNSSAPPAAVLASVPYYGVCAFISISYSSIVFSLVSVVSFGYSCMRHKRSCLSRRSSSLKETQGCGRTIHMPIDK